MSVGPDSALYLVKLVCQDLNMFNDVLAVIGCCYVGKLVIQFTWAIMNGIKTHGLSKLCFNVDMKNSYGKWAVVTGCTEGIGKAYAFELACRGLNIVLISRNEEKLQKISTDIESLYKVQAKVIVADFSLGPVIYSKINEVLNILDVGVLVNNVGVISPRPMYLREVTQESIWEHINVNIGAVTMMTHLVLPSMLERKKGMIVNVSSLAADTPMPLLTIYSATKAYVSNFSVALHHELKGTGINVQTLSPSYVNTKMVSYSPYLMSSLFVPDPSVFVKHALPTLKYSSHTTGYWLHGMQAWLFSSIPRSLRIHAMGTVNKYFRRIALEAHS